MQRAKEAAQQLLGKAGHHDTTLHETVAPAAVQETRRVHKHEQAQTVIDKEVHQDHYHTSIQPIVDREVLPEKHEHNIVGTEHRHHDHAAGHNIEARLQQEAAQFKSRTIDGGVRESRETAATVVGEHKHHHVHEIIQPVVQKETIQPHVVHTIVPVHEVHREAPTHHGASALPAISMQEYKQQGGVLSGREEIRDAFAGEPRIIGSTGTSGVGQTTTGHHHHHGQNTTGTTSTTGNTGTTTGHPSLLQKLNPKTDTDGDGKRGVLE